MNGQKELIARTARREAERRMNQVKHWEDNAVADLEHLGGGAEELQLVAAAAERLRQRVRQAQQRAVPRLLTVVSK